MTCQNVSQYAPGPCNVCGLPASSVHFVERGNSDGHDIALLCEQCCPTHKPAEEKVYTAPPVTITGKQEPLF